MEYKRMSVEQPLLTNCCGVFSLRTGCFILGYLNLILNSLWTIVATSFLVYTGVMTHGFDHIDEWKINNDGIAMTVSDSTELAIFALALGLVLLINLVGLLLNIACLVGLHKKRPGPIRVYVVFSAVCLFLLVSGTIYWHISNSNITPKSFAVESFEFALSAYFIMVYYVYANQLEKELKENKPDTSSVASLDTAYIYPVTIDKQVLVQA